MHSTHQKAIADATSDRSKKMNSDDYSSTHRRVTPQELLEIVKTLPPDWALVAVGDQKRPLSKGWQNVHLTQADFEQAIQTGQFESLFAQNKQGETYHPLVTWWHAIGVLCGTSSQGLIFVDHDGANCDSLIEQLSGQNIAEAFPRTVGVTSGREGRYQLIYKVPERFWGAISTKKIPTGGHDDDGKPEQLELRWNGCQSVVAGHHPITGSYQWLPGQSPQDCEIAECPTWIIDQMLKEIPLHQPHPTKSTYQSELLTWNDQDWARFYLEVIPPTEDYDTWIKVGMALQSVDENLLADWDDWSRGATNYESGVCDKHWKSFKPDKGIGIGTLGELAKQNGWQSPFKENKNDRPALTVLQGRSRSQSLASSLEETDEDFEDLTQEVQALVQLTEESAPTQNLLTPRLTIPLTHRAKQFNVPLEAFLAIFLPVVASLLKIGTQLEINAASGHYCRPILWTGLVGESGANKSPIFDSIIRPLEALQAQADEIYQLELEQYEEELEDWQKRPKEERGKKPAPPLQREYYLQDTTMEATATCLSNQPQRGVVLPIDELAGFVNGFNQYRSGRGNDRQKFLSAYGGGSIKVNRKSGPRISLTQTSISLTGTIQPNILCKLMHDLDEVDGFWARLLWAPLPLTEMPPPGEGVNHDLFSLLLSLYQKLEALEPQIYRFDRQGQAVWRDWHILCEQNKVNEPNPALRAIYPKSKERAARIALVVHCINAAIEDRVPDPIIPAELLAAAISFTKWSIGQTRLIYADAGAVSHEDTARIVRFVERFKNRGWITARQVTHWWPAKPKPKAEAARTFMRKVVDLGYAIDNGKAGKDYAIQIKENPTNMGNNRPLSSSSLGIDAGNSDSNNLVTNTNKPASGFQEPSCEPPTNAGSLQKNAIAVVTPDGDTPETKPSLDSSESPAGLLLDGASVVTSSNRLPEKGSQGFCYPVTGSNLQVGDVVVLTGEGIIYRPPGELKAVWVIEMIHGMKAAVSCESLGRRSFPLTWLVRYGQPTE